MKHILNGIVTAAVSGAVGASGAMLVDPSHFNLGNHKSLGIVAGVGALMGVLNWLRQFPLPIIAAK